MAGTENQCLGVAQALGIRADIFRIGLHAPWKQFSPYLRFEQSWSFSPRLPAPPWPDLLLACGRKSIAASRYIKKASGGKTFTVQIQDPRCPLEDFDLVAVTAHDPSRGENVIVTPTASNLICPERLARARGEFSSLFAFSPSPRLAVLIGGNSKAHRLTSARMETLAHALGHVEAFPMITASRRTGDMEKSILRQALSAKQKPFYFWDETGENPYMGLLAWADFILVTEDSVSMLSDAAETAKPLYILPLEGGTKRLRRFHDSVVEGGIARWFSDNQTRLTRWTYPPPQSAQMIAQAILQRTSIEVDPKPSDSPLP